MLIAAECEHRDGLHVNADHLVVELGHGEGVDADGPRELVVSDLHNYGMPLLRYVNGDLATPGHGRCACGRGLPRLASVDPPQLDALRTPDGRFVPGEYVVYAFLHATRGSRRATRWCRSAWRRSRAWSCRTKGSTRASSSACAAN